MGSEYYIIKGSIMDDKISNLDEIISISNTQDNIIISETDTRCKIIDKTLENVLSWPSSNVTREDHVSGNKNGYTDYILKVRDRNLIVVEAKRKGLFFELPSDKKHKRLKLTSFQDYCHNPRRLLL